MKVLRKQENSKMCIICGMDNPLGVKAQFYTMEDKSVMSAFSFKEYHQSYPGRVHGGMISAFLDELGFRSLWVDKDDVFGVTMNMTTKFNKPVPYNKKLIGRGVVVRESKLFVESKAEIYDEDFTLLASSEIKYMKLPENQIQEGIKHEEINFLIEDGVKEIPWREKDEENR